MASQGGTKRSRKGKGVAPSSSAEPPPQSRFLDQEAIAKYSSYRFKQVKFGRVVDIDSNLNGNGLNVQTLLEYQGLDKFLATDMGVFPDLVQEFYANLRHPLEGSGRPIRTKLISRVNGVDISFDEDELAIALELDQFAHSSTVYKYSDVQTIDPNFDLLHALNTICQAPQAHTSHIRDSSLKLPCHIIHRILVHSINPRSGSFDQCPKLDIYYVWAIFTQKRINWPGLVFSLLKNGAKRKDANLVFGIALTKLFTFYNTIEGATVVKLSTDDYFTETTIQRFGYHVVNDLWVRKAGAIPQPEPDLQDDPMAQDVDEEMDAPPPSSSQYNPTNFELMQAIQELGQEFRQDHQELRHGVHLLRQDMHRMDLRLNAFQGALQAHWPDYVFPPPPNFDE